MGVRKPVIKPMTAVKTDFVNSLQNVMDKGNLLVSALDAAMGRGAFSNEQVAAIVQEHLTNFKTAMYGADDGKES